jgi:hypothetical protein
MRTVDPRTKFTRRGVLRTTAAAVPAAALMATGTTISPTAVWAQEAKALKPATMATLVLMARDIYPHDHLVDQYYIIAVSPWDGKAANDPAIKALIEDGVKMLDVAAGAKFGTKSYLGTPWEEQRVALLQDHEPTPFFRKIQGDLAVSLYNQHDLWPKFGYEGASADKGGYIHRGFNDVDWLPQS